MAQDADTEKPFTGNPQLKAVCFAQSYNAIEKSDL